MFVMGGTNLVGFTELCSYVLVIASLVLCPNWFRGEGGEKQPGDGGGADPQWELGCSQLSTVSHWDIATELWLPEIQQIEYALRPSWTDVLAQVKVWNR